MHKTSLQGIAITRRAGRISLLACSSALLVATPGFAQSFTMQPGDTAAVESPETSDHFVMQASDVAATSTVYSGSQSAGDASLETSGDDAVIFRDQATASSATIINNGGQTRFENTSTAASANLTANDTGAIRFGDTSTAADARITVNEGGALSFDEAARAGSAFITTNGGTQFSGNSSADNAQITVNQSGGVTFTENADGGIARIANSGTTTFEGTSTLAGGQITNNSTGTVAFRDQSSGGTTALIANSGTVNFEDNSTLGSAALTNNETGRVGFSGAATAGDGFISNSGDVRFSDRSSAGSAEIIGNVGSQLRFEDTSTAAQAEITGRSDVTFADQAQAGAAAINMGSGATLAFTGEASGGTSRVQLDDGAALDISARAGTVGIGQLTGAGEARLGANTLAFGDATPLSNFDGTISDGGQGGGLVKRGTGTVNLSGTSTYSGATHIQDGILEAGRENAFAARSAFTIDESATLGLADFDQRIGSLAGSGLVDLVGATLSTGDNGLSTAFSGSLSGTGALIKLGQGTLTLSGLSSYTGSTSVEGGGLQVDGSIAQSAVSVAEGAALSGSGVVGSASIAGTLIARPGGGLTVVSDLSLSPTASFIVEMSGARAGLVAVGGDVFVNGTLQLAQNGGLRAGDYTFTTADGTITGTFDAISADLTFLDTDVIYGTSSLVLRLVRNAVAFADVAQTRNQRATAGAIEALGADNELYAETLGLDPAQARSGFDLLSGEIHAQALDTMAMLSSSNRRSLLNHLASTQNSGVWVQGGYQQSDTGSDGNAASIRASGPWGLAGVDFSVREDIRIGLAGFYGQTEIANPARLSSGDIESLGVAAYADWRHGPWRLAGGADYTHHDIGLTRQARLGGLSGIATSDSAGWTAGVFAELGYQVKIEGTTIEPFVGLSWTRASGGGFSETGAGPANLASSGTDFDRTDAEIGLRVQRAWQLNNGVSIKPSLYAAYTRRLTGSEASSAHNYAGGLPFVVYSSTRGENAATVEARVNLQFRENLEATTFYRGTFTGDDTAHAVGGGLRIGF